MSDQDDSQKTEEPTHKRLEEAFKRGQGVQTKEIGNFTMMLAFVFVVGVLAPQASSMSYRSLERFITMPHQYHADGGNLQRLFADIVVESLWIMALITGCCMFAGIIGNTIYRKVSVSWDPVTPKWSKISPMKGLGRIFSRRNLMELVKGLIKIGVLGAICVYAVIPYMGIMQELPTYDTVDFLKYMKGTTVKMLTAVCIALAAIALFDYFYQRFEFMKSMRMSRQELKDEYKESEGDPHIKGKLKSIRMERARKRMMSNVPTADVVITNPTHYAVALKYDRATMKAPALVAKGQDLVALKIRELAKENDVPIVENPPLARTLHAQVEIDQEIPTEYYQAVAEIISYVYKLRNKLK